MNLKEIWQQIIDNFSFLISVLKALQSWGRRSIGRKLFVIFLFSLVSISPPTYYIYSLFHKSQSIAEQNNLERDAMLNRHVLESAIEIVNLCIEARDKQLDLENYYCDFARVKYRQFNDIVTIDSSAVEKIKSDNAYELMVLDLNGRLKNLEYSEMRRKLPKDNFGKQLNLLLQDAVIYLFLFIYILLMIGLLVLFNTKSHNKQGYMLEKPKQPHINKY